MMESSMGARGKRLWGLGILAKRVLLLEQVDPYE